MNILVTGAKGFVGRNLVAALKNIRDGKDRTRGGLVIGEIYEYDIDSTLAELDDACMHADFVFNLAGVNRPKDNSEFMAGNFGFASDLLETLKRHKNLCPVMLSSSIQATLAGRFGNSEYGRSKKAGEELFFEYSRETGAKVLVYRFPNLFGKWCRPNYNSAVATFCNNIANDLPIQVNDPNVDMELLYIDDLVEETIAASKGAEHHAGTQSSAVMVFRHDSLCLSQSASGAVIADDKATAIEVADWSHRQRLFHGHVAIFARFRECDTLRASQSLSLDVGTRHDAGKRRLVAVGCAFRIDADATLSETQGLFDLLNGLTDTGPDAYARDYCASHRLGFTSMIERMRSRRVCVFFASVMSSLMLKFVSHIIMKSTMSIESRLRSSCRLSSRWMSSAAGMLSKWAVRSATIRAKSFSSII